MDLIDYLAFVISAGLQLYSALSGSICLHPTLRPAVKEASTPSAPSSETRLVAMEILTNLPPGAAVCYEPPDGGRLMVWWIESGPVHRGEGDGYRLW
ncbi:hypothetical protein ACI2LO_30950 [Streptomyces sp. NPDC033754]|uniref:hypothetical protein n=1 Tax=unclassified Streptomyces TaxID=2593676 RepID=UPI0033F794FB